MTGAWHPDSTPWFSRNELVSGDWKRDLREGKKVALIRAEPAMLVRAVGDPKDRTLEFVCATEGVKRDGYNVRIGDIAKGDQYGFDFSVFAKNPVMLWCHDYGTPQRPPYPPIGNWSNWGIDTVGGKRCLVARAYFARWALAQIAYDLYLPKERGGDGSMKSVSIGWECDDYEEVKDARGAFAYWDMLRNLLFEISGCPLGKDTDALATAMRSGQIPADLHGCFDDWFNLKNVVHGRAYVLSSRDMENAPELRPAPPPAEPATRAEGEQDALAAALAPFADGLKRAIGDALKSGALPAEGDGAAAAGRSDDEEPLRWNRQLSRAWDVTRERFPEGTPELEVAARYLDSEVRDIWQFEDVVPSARMGAFLSALDETLGEWAVEDVRRIEWNSSQHRSVEYPPVFETIRLNSTSEREFLIDGTRFMKSVHAPVVFRVGPGWQGLSLTAFCVREKRQVVLDWLERTHRRAADLKFLKGEAFSLGGEFLERTSETWDDLFLEGKNAEVIRRQIDLLNEKGGDLPSRGIILAGPPGTGKTLAGRVMMAAAKDATFIWISARDIYYAGAFGSFRHAFGLARENAPTILFIEDVDDSFRPSTIDLLKTEMDGVQRNRGVVTVLTTNFPERIPEALIDRPGRFHDVLKLDLPDAEARGRMLARWLPDLTDGELRERVVEETASYSGAHMRELANFVGVLREQEKLDLPAAVTQALAKIKEQRELITSMQAGTPYRPRRALEADLPRVLARHAAALGTFLNRNRPALAKRSALSDQCDVDLARVRAAYNAIPLPLDSLFWAVNALNQDDQPPSGDTAQDTMKAGWKADDIARALRNLNIVEALTADLVAAEAALRATLLGDDRESPYGDDDDRPEGMAALTKDLAALQQRIEGRAAGDTLTPEVLELCARIIRIGKKIAKTRKILLESVQTHCKAGHEITTRILADAADGELDGKVKGDDDNEGDDDAKAKAAAGAPVTRSVEAEELTEILDNPESLARAMPPDRRTPSITDFARAMEQRESDKETDEKAVRAYVDWVFAEDAA